MDVTTRDIEKLKGLGYRVGHREGSGWWASARVIISAQHEKEADAWAACKAHAQSPEGMKVTMADKIDWLLANGYDFLLIHNGKPVKSAAFTDEAFWKVP